MNQSVPPKRFETSKPFHILQISDCHLMSDPNQTFAGILPLKSLQAVLAHATQHVAFDCILNTGDIAQEPVPEAYHLYLETVKQLKRPHYWVRGNHDENQNFPSLNQDDHPNVILAGNWCIILLNSQENHQVSGHIDGYDLEQLEQLLTKYQDFHVLLALHHNTFDVGCAWLAPHQLQNSAQFVACIERHRNVRAVISGHVHQEFHYQHGQTTFLSCPSTSIQFKPHSAEFRLDDLPPGYRTLALYPDGRFETAVHRIDAQIGAVDMELKSY